MLVSRHDMRLYPLPMSNAQASVDAEAGFIFGSAVLTLLEVEREKRQQSNPDLVLLEVHVEPDECCAPRKLNALKLHR